MLKGPVSALDAFRECLSRVLLKEKARCRSSGMIDHGVRQSAGPADNGNGAVPQGDHLAQAAGLIERGHQEQV